MRLRDRDPLEKPLIVHLWSAVYDGSTPCRRRLGEEERRRADEFLRAEQRDFFVWSRAKLRTWLGAETGTAPEAIKLRIGLHGKPELLESTLSFNLSHSGNRLICATVPEVPVGIDLEAIRPVVDYPHLAERYLASEEVRLFRADPTCETFLRGWVRKEARAKALGIGLTDTDIVLGDGWSTLDLEVGPGFVAALAVRAANPLVAYLADL